MSEEEMLMIAAASMLAGKIFDETTNGGRTWHTRRPSKSEVQTALDVAKEIWLQAVREES